MKAIILAAGKGGRLSPYTDACPKCLIKIGDRSILDYQLDALEAAGITNVVIVTGYLKEQVAAYLKSRQKMVLTILENDIFAETNTAYSLWLARHEMTDDFVYLNGDVLLHPEIIRRLTCASASVALAVERKTCGEEEVKVILDGSRITGLSKDVPPADAYGEFIGIAKFSKGFGPLFRQSLEEVVERDNLPNAYFELALERIISRAILTAVDITDLPAVEIDFPEDLERAAREILPLVTQRNFPERKKILFYIERNLHIPFLEPIFDHFASDTVHVLAWHTIPYVEPGPGKPGMGLTRDEKERLGRKAEFIDNVATYAPDVTVCADACTHLSGCGKLVFVGHGMISKGGFYTDSPMVRRENRADLICVPGPGHQEILRKNVFSPIAVTGFIKSDTFFNGHSIALCKEFRRNHGVPDGARLVLFAPTFNEELSAIPCLKEDIRELADERTVLLIKLHTMTDPAWALRYRALAESNPYVCFIDDIDAAPALLAADVLISDVSSVVLEFMLMDKPVIVVNNPRIRQYSHYREDDIEYRVRDACLQVTTLPELRQALLRTWSNPGEFSEKRRYYAERYSYGRDGKSALRAAQSIEQLLDGGFDPVRSAPALAIIAKWGYTPSDTEITRFLDEVERTARGSDWRVYLLGNRPAGFAGDPRIAHWFDTFGSDGLSVNKVAMMSQGDYLVFTTPSISYPLDWPRWMTHHFRFNPKAGTVLAFSDSHDYQRVTNQVFPGIHFADHAVLSNALLATVMGVSFPVENMASPCVIIPKKLVFECGGLSAKSIDESLWEFGTTLRQHGYTVHQAIDVFCQRNDTRNQ